MALPRPETTGAFVGEVAFINAGRFGAEGGVQVFGLRLRGALVLLQVTRHAQPDSKCARARFGAIWATLVSSVSLDITKTTHSATTP